MSDAAAAVSIKLTCSGGAVNGASLSSAVQLLNRSHKSWNKLFKFMIFRSKCTRTAAGTASEEKTKES